MQKISTKISFTLGRTIHLVKRHWSKQAFSVQKTYIYMLQNIIGSYSKEAANFIL